MSNADTLSDHGSGMRIVQRSSLILSRLPPQMTTQLFACASDRAIKAGEALFVAGDRGDGCYRVEQGLVKITVTSDRGEERIIALVGAVAAMAGVARENVSRVLSDLRKRGVIEQYSQSYVLNDIRALEREVHH